MSEGYSTNTIIWLLSNYVSLQEGRLPEPFDDDVSEEVFTGSRKGRRATFEMPVIYKCDIDRAIQSLRPTERLIIIAVTIFSHDYKDVAFWISKTVKEVRYMEERALEHMRYFLGGKK